MTTLVVAAISLVLAVLSAIGFALSNNGGLAVIAVGAAVFLVALLGINFIVLTPMAMWKEQRDKIRVYETPQLFISYDDADLACKRDKYLGDHQLGERLWRVRIKGSQGTLIKGVVVQLEAIEPSIDDLPQALHPMTLPWKGLPTEWEGDGSFDIRPGATAYVDIIRYVPSYGQESSQLELVLQSYRKAVPFRTHTLTLSAQGQEGPRITKRFQLEVNPDNLTRFYPLDVSVS